MPDETVFDDGVTNPVPNPEFAHVDIYLELDFDVNAYSTKTMLLYNVELYGSTRDIIQDFINKKGRGYTIVSPNTLEIIGCFWFEKSPITAIAKIVSIAEMRKERELRTNSIRNEAASPIRNSGGFLL